MVNPRNILNKLRWKQDCDLKKAEIWYVHRGAPNNTRIIWGKDIIELEKSFMKTTDAMIPYHRIYKILYDDQIIFERIKIKQK
jgi:uncharacterized protein (UPF0248 family)